VYGRGFGRVMAVALGTLITLQLSHETLYFEMVQKRYTHQVRELQAQLQSLKQTQGCDPTPAVSKEGTPSVD
jgi:hypothetical protein